MDVPFSGVDATEAAIPDVGLGWALIQTMLVLAMVLALAWLTLNVGLRRLLGIRAPVRGPPLVNVLERVPLDQKRALFVVEAGGEVLLIGGGDGSLSLISKLNKAEIEKVRPNIEGVAAVKMSPFLMKLLGRSEAPAPAEPPSHVEKES